MFIGMRCRGLTVAHSTVLPTILQCKVHEARIEEEKKKPFVLSSSVMCKILLRDHVSSNTNNISFYLFEKLEQCCLGGPLPPTLRVLNVNEYE